MLKNFRRIRVAYEIFLTSDFFHTCVAARIMEELHVSRLSYVRGYHVYQDVWDAATGEILPLSTFSTSAFAISIALEGIELLTGPLGSGSPSFR